MRALSLLLVVGLTLPLAADEKGKGEEKPPVKGGDPQIEKIVQEVTRRVLEELRHGKQPLNGDAGKKNVKGGDVKKPLKGDGSKPHIVRVDLNKLPPDVAKVVEKFAEHEGQEKKGDGKPPEKGKPDGDKKPEKKG